MESAQVTRVRRTRGIAEVNEELRTEVDNALDEEVVDELLPEVMIAAVAETAELQFETVFEGEVFTDIGRAPRGSRHASRQSFPTKAYAREPHAHWGLYRRRKR